MPTNETSVKQKKSIGKYLFNGLIIAVTLFIVVYFFVSENGLLDLLRSTIELSIPWLIIAFLVQWGNVFMDVLVTYLFVSKKYQHFKMLDAVKVALVGTFFSAVTPTGTGGQPAQVFLMSKLKIDYGYSISCMMQKFIVYQIVSTICTMLAIFLRFSTFRATFDTPILMTLVIIGTITQLTVTIGLLLICYTKKTAVFIMRFIVNLLAKLRIIKDPQKTKREMERQASSFRRANKSFSKDKKVLITSYFLVFIQMLFILSVPYCIYRGFNFNGPYYIDMLCSQTFVNLSSSLIPLPGATGAAEFTFTGFFGLYFTPETMKSAVLIWRIFTYYGNIVICAPFSYLAKEKDDISPIIKKITQKNK